MKPYFEKDGVTIYHGDCREIAASVRLDCDAIIADPPYSVTDLEWDQTAPGWLDVCARGIAWHGSAWIFGSLRSLLALGEETKGWRFAQDIVWEKHNGSSLHADRFRRVHELAAHYYRRAWSDVFKDPQYTRDATARSVRRKTRPVHWNRIDDGHYISHDGGPRLMRSVLRVRSCHGEAVHPTQKPVALLDPLVRFSCPSDGVVLDPFMGSGSTLVAARSAGRRAIGVEIEERYCEIAAKRLAQGVMPFETSKET